MAQIGEITKRLGISTDTLRYYEKIGLLPPVYRKPSGLRLYGAKDISRIKFIKRAKYMGFSLDEIKKLLRFREAPQNAKPDVRQLVSTKLEEIENHLDDLKILQAEFRLLINLCSDDLENCPILDAMDNETAKPNKEN